MPSPPKHTRRWFQFGLGAMFLLVTAFGVWLGWELRYIRQRAEFLRWVRENEGESGREPMQIGNMPPTGSIPIWRKWLGDEPVGWMHVPIDDRTANFDEVRAKADALFSESDIRFSGYYNPDPKWHQRLLRRMPD